MLLVCLLFTAALTKKGAPVNNLGPEFENRYEAYVPPNGKTVNWGATCPYVPQANKPPPAFDFELPIRPELLPQAASAYDWSTTCSLKNLEYLVVPNGTYTLAERRAALPPQFDVGCDASLSRRECRRFLPAFIIAGARAGDRARASASRARSRALPRRARSLLARARTCSLAARPRDRPRQ